MNTSLYWRLQCNKRILLLWCVSTKEGRTVRVKSATTRWREAKHFFHSPTVVPLWTSCRLVLSTQWCLVSSQEDVKTALLPSVVVVVVSLCCVRLRWSEAEDVVPERAETAGSVSIGAVPVGFSEPVLGRHPNVQDLGVSTRHCQAEETEEKRLMDEQRRDSERAPAQSKKR